MRGVNSGTAPRDLHLLETSGWGGIWQWTVFDFHHYHADEHEVLETRSRGETRMDPACGTAAF